jgi:hypothetical protein
MHRTNHRDDGNAPINKRDVVAGYGDLVRSRIDLGWSASLMSFMFRALPGGPAAVVQQMRREIEHVFTKFLTRVTRRPCSPASADRLPVLIASPDLPVFKREKRPLHDIAVNNGLHAHGILLLPPVSRLRVPAGEHFRENQSAYADPRSMLDRIDVRAIDSNPEVVTDYALKALKSGRVDLDDLILLPRSVSEL